LVALPRGLGNWLIPHLWRSTYPLILPLTISVVGGCLQAGAGTGLHALGAARRSARVMVLSSAIFVVCGVAGALADGTVGAMWGAAAAGWIGAVMFWWELRSALGEASDV